MRKVAEVKTSYKSIISTWNCNNTKSYTEHLRFVYNVLKDENFLLEEFRARMDSSWKVSDTLVCDSKKAVFSNWDEILDNNIMCIQLCGKLNKNDIKINVSMPLYSDGEIIVSSDKEINIDAWVSKHGQIGENNEDFTNRRCDVHEKNIEEHLVS